MHYQAEYQNLVGSLIFFTNVKPNIAFAISYVSCYMTTPQLAHMDTTKKILSYIKGTTDLGLLFPRKDTGQIVGYVDANWARDLDRKRSTIGLLFKLGCNSIVWSSKLQPIWHYP
jgi:hypothetical protein